MNRIITIVLAAAAAILIILYLVEVLPEHLAGLLLGPAVVLISCAYLWRILADAARSGRARIIGVALTVATFVLALAPAYTTVAPGEPAATGGLATERDALTLPEDTRRAELV